VREAIDHKRELLQQQLDILLVRELEEQDEYDVLESRLQQTITTRLAARALTWGGDAVDAPDLHVKDDNDNVRAAATLGA